MKACSIFFESSIFKIQSMQNNQLNLWIRIAVAICGLALLAVLFLPIWRIDLAAPQYPEGLRMLIYANKLGGDVEIINGLNHYIGMKTLHAEDFIEFSVLTYIIGVYALLFLIVAAIGNRKLLYAMFGLFAAFGVLAMMDFWRWEYNYGHNLDPKAAIVVPGMAYQPPLIGFKQLLNFGAYSIPDIGGWIFIGVGVILIVCVIIEARGTIKLKKSGSLTTVILGLLTLTLFSSCSAQPKPVRIGIDQCDHCKMTVSDARFPAEILTKKGKIYILDDIHCVLGLLKEKPEIKKEIKDIFLSDYTGNHSFINASAAHLIKSVELRSPMGGNIAAFSNIDSMNIVMETFKAESVIWNDIIQ